MSEKHFQVFVDANLNKLARATIEPPLLQDFLSHGIISSTDMDEIVQINTPQNQAKALFKILKNQLSHLPAIIEILRKHGNSSAAGILQIFQQLYGSEPPAYTEAR